MCMYVHVCMSVLCVFARFLKNIFDHLSMVSEYVVINGNILDKFDIGCCLIKDKVTRSLKNFPHSQESKLSGLETCK